MEPATLSVAETLLAALQSAELTEIFSDLGYQHELDGLESVIRTVKVVLLDAENTGDEISHQAQSFIEALKVVVYDADDLLDELVTLANRKHRKQIKEGAGKASEMVRRFYASKISGVTRTMCQRVTEIRKKLEYIADGQSRYRLELDLEPIRRRRVDTCPYVDVEDIIGRDGDKEKIVGMLLDPNVRQDVSFLTIVGMGGLGKTTLAQLIYNDERITMEFPTRIWVCVGYVDPNHMDVKEVLAKIVESITGAECEGYSLHALQGQIRQQLAGNKFLIILDDVWSEDRSEWLPLENILKGGLIGSWVVVTTRSRKTASIIGDGFMYELEGLPDEDSWQLFEINALSPVQRLAYPPGLVDIGKKIVKKCRNVPLAMTVVGSVLCCKEERQWTILENSEWVKLSPEMNSIICILKLSYTQLISPLKSCFSYCAIFPKDHVIEKEKLIRLWMAQGYIVPLDGAQTIEDAAEEYFLILLQRCFFQDVEKDEYGRIISCKMHVLMHDLAQHIARNGVRVSNYINSDLDEIRHLSVIVSIGLESQSKSKLRTLLCLWQKQKGLPVDKLLRNMMSLRALDLSDSAIESLPNSIGGLVHLRYLDLSGNDNMKALPESIINLHNLQTLILAGCRGLIELPANLGKLANLRFLDTKHCELLTHMPEDMSELCCLQKLTMFVVNLSKASWVDQLKGLKCLKQLKGSLQIKIHEFENDPFMNGDSSEGGYLKNKQYLDEIEFSNDARLSYYVEAFMEVMQPHPNLKGLKLVCYNGMSMPSWGVEDNLVTSLPNLVNIELYRCDGFQYLPSMGRLHHLRSLVVKEMMNLEYMEENRYNMEAGAAMASGSSGPVEDFLFFPSLKVLKLWDLPRLKGWWRDDDDDSSSIQTVQPPALPSFPPLSGLMIEGCPELTSIPSFPSVEVLVLKQFNERLVIRGVSIDDKGRGEEGQTCCYAYRAPKLRRVTTDNITFLKSALLMEELQCLTDLRICYDDKVESLELVSEVLSSLLSLSVYKCSNMTNVVKGGLEHLTALQTLLIYDCSKLTLTPEEDEGLPTPLPPFHHSLRSLTLHNLPKLVNLPEWMQHLTSLKSLKITFCKALESMPEWMPNLTSLTNLEVLNCSNTLMQRCQSPSGEDWPRIQHIRHIKLSGHEDR